MATAHKKKPAYNKKFSKFHGWYRKHERPIIILLVILFMVFIGGRLIYDKLTSAVLPPFAQGIPGGANDDYYRDATRSLHLAAVSQDLEKYRGLTGYYPTLSQINDTAWREANTYDYKDNFYGYSDPEGQNRDFAASPTMHRYAYQASGCTVKGCTGYTLTAILHDGTQIHKHSVQ